jgi:protein gp37
MSRVILPLDPPGIVRPAEDLADLARRINAEHEAGRKAQAEAYRHYAAAGEHLLKAKENEELLGKWVAWLEKNIRCSLAHAYRYMEFSRFLTVRNLNPVKLTGADLDTAEAEWLRITGRIEEERDEPVPEVVTLDQWGEANEATRKWILSATGEGKMNVQDNDHIEWAQWSWNPVTGCEHNCPYCYARDIANRFYDKGFAPCLYPFRLQSPYNTSVPEAKIVALENDGTPDDKAKALGLTNVFTCSMADLFGRWVPKEWIEAVLDTVRGCPQWTFLFLTKFPIRMAEFKFPANTWVGTTVDCQARVKNAERAFRKVRAGIKWLSCEPLIEPLRFSDLGAFDWMVLGGASKSSQTPEWRPPYAWVQSLKEAANKAGCLVYEKTNLYQRERSYPNLPWVVRDEAPESLHYLPSPEQTP